MEETDPPPTRSARPPRPSPRSFWNRLFGRPALAIARSAERAAGHWREQLAARYGPDVPQQEVDAFEEAHMLGQRRADQLETVITGAKSGAQEEQRRRAAAGVRR